MSAGGSARDAEFRAFVQEHGGTLVHAARLLTGDPHHAEDVVQGALIKLYLHWPRVRQPLAYARRAVVTGYVDTTRRRMASEFAVESVPDRPGAVGAATAVEERDGLRRLLADLDPRERAVIILRYYCDLPERQVAAELGLPLGTVKSSAARALARLRVDAEDPTTQLARGGHQ